MPDYSEGNLVLNVFNSPMTRATVDPGTDYERQLNRLDCFFYVKDKTNEPCVYYQKVEINDIGSAKVSFFVDDITLRRIFPSGALCDIFVIANHPGSPEFEAEAPNTTIEELGKYLLDMTKKEYDAVDKPFVMVGSGRVQKGKNSNATATIALERVASKVTMTVKIPKSIEVDKGIEKVTMLPVLKDNDGDEPLKTSFRYGTNKGYLSGASYPDDDANYIWTEKIPYTHSEALSTDEYYAFTCDVPFYTYARAWEKGADNAAYVTFEIPWGEDVNEDGVIDNNYKTYYYQILVNGKGRNFEPNAWYDMTVKVGILGSTIETEPRLLEDMTYYILDWTTEPESDHMGGGDRFENVEIENYTYLVVQNSRLEIDNTSTGTIEFDASHNVEIAISKKARPVEGIPGLTTGNDVGAFYIDCSGDNPVVGKLEITEDKNFKIDNTNGKLTFTHEITQDSKIYSPVYVYATIWLELDGVKGMSDDEKVFSHDIVIVQYPAMFIEPELSNPYSIYVNNVQHNDQNTEYRITAGGTTHTLGRSPGVSGSWGTKNSYMYTITVSSFTAGNTFKAHDGNTYPYIIGDPRQRISDLELDGDGISNVASNWVSSNAVHVDDNGNVVKDENGEIQYTQRTLQYYYPTSSEGNSFQIVSPKFKIVSFHSSGWGYITAHGAKMRCATFQEDGYPAGRWRLPTEAEIMYVIDLQKAGVVKGIFYSEGSSSAYFCATENGNTSRYKMSAASGSNTWTSATTGSVRCVYDEWFWGSDREAKENPNYNENANYGNGLDNNSSHANNEYLFTWGDKKIW